MRLCRNCSSQSKMIRLIRSRIAVSQPAMPIWDTQTRRERSSHGCARSRPSWCRFHPVSQPRASGTFVVGAAPSVGRDDMSQTRRLAAILAADVAGYSRLIGADEEGTLERLKTLRRDLLDPKIAEYRGRLVKTTGDGLAQGGRAEEMIVGHERSES